MEPSIDSISTICSDMFLNFIKLVHILIDNHVTIWYQYNALINSVEFYYVNFDL